MSLAGTLGRFARAAPAKQVIEGERCELCGAAVGPEHRHLVDLKQRTLTCACQPCALLFERPGAAAGRFKTVPTRVLADPAFQLSEEEWAALEIPVQLAFLFRNSAANRWVGVYPSAAGPVESALPLGAWEPLVEKHALLRAAEPDVEAVVCYAPRGEKRVDAFLVPIDLCYQLVARVRTRWRGFHGREARQEIDAFFARLESRSRPLKER